MGASESNKVAKAFLYYSAIDGRRLEADGSGFVLTSLLVHGEHGNDSRTLVDGSVMTFSGRIVNGFLQFSPTKTFLSILLACDGRHSKYHLSRPSFLQVRTFVFLILASTMFVGLLQVDCLI